MRIRNISTVPVVAAGLAIPPGRIGNIPEAEWREWMALSSGNALTASTKLRVESDAPPADDGDDTPPADDGGGDDGEESKAETAEVPADDSKPKPKSKR